MEERKRICMVVPDPLVKGGIAAVTQGYYGSALERDFDITYVQSYRDGSKWDKLFKALQGYGAFLRVLRKNRPDLVHIHSSFGPSFYRKLPFILFSKVRGIPVVNHIHGSAFDEFYAAAPGWKKKLVSWTYGLCDRIIVLSAGWRETIGTVTDRKRITVIPNYTKEHPEAVTDAHLRERFARKQVLFLGVLTEGKGIREMPAVFAKVLEQVPAVFVLAGEGEKEALLSEASEAVREHLVFPGWVRGEEKEKLLFDSAVFFLPSHMEAMPMSVLEAEGYGLPVVSTDIGGIPFVVENGKGGSLVAPKDVDGYAAALVRYLTDEEAFAAAARASFGSARERFSFDAHTAALEKVWREIIYG